METAEGIESFGSTKAPGKRSRPKEMPRSPSLMTMPSAAKHVRQERAAGVPASSSLPAGGAGMGVGGGGAAPRGNFSGYLVDAETTAAFLKACGLCNRRLGPGHDTFMYRGEVAFCSHECREQQIQYDERMEQTCSLTSGSDQSGSGGETVAAA